MTALPGDPPRPGFSLLKRFVVGAVAIVVLAAAPVATALLLELDQAVSIFERYSAPLRAEVTNALDDVEPGRPQTLVLLGSDRRYVDKSEGNPVRSDTIMLVRLDPDKKATAVMSIPRDLRVRIPGHGTTKINEAFALGGPRLTLRTLRRLLGIPIHHVVIVNFGGFQRAVNRLGCVYVDVDRKYFNDNQPPRGGGPRYATIDVEAGYQKLCGMDSLDYVRYRHFDDDFVRAARQQDYLRQAKDQIGVAKLFSDRDQLLEIFGRYTQTDIRGSEAVLRLLKLAFEASKNPIREVKFRGGIDPDDLSYVDITEENLRKTVDEFTAVRASAGPRATPRSKSSRSERRQRSRRRGGLAPGLVEARREAEDQVLKMGTRAGFPVYFPSVKIATGAYARESPRRYTIADRGGRRYDAYRIVVAQGENGQYYGVQGTTWKAPPILDDPSATIRMRGRKYQIHYDGNRIRLIAWRTDSAVYWVSNTLSQRLTNRQMTGLARSLTRVGA